jgi:hypothetical protein
VRFDWEQDENGKRMGSRNYRIEVMDTDGTNRHEVSLVNAKLNSVDYPDWRYVATGQLTK